MPGTWGSLPAFPIAALIFLNTGHAGYWIIPFVIIALFIAGTYATHVYTTKTGKHDPKEVVVDEVVGQLITLYAASPIMGSLPDHGGVAGYSILFASFVLFRLFDILKPWPVGWADRKVPGAFGVMLDDVLAGVMASIVLHLGAYLFFLLQ